MRRHKGQFQSGDKHPRWKGGRSIRTDGYVILRIPNHHRANGNGYVREHIIIMEKKLGRKLKPKERVHHLNGDRADNRPENLITFPSHSEHLKTHGINKGVKYWGANAHLNVEAIK